MSFIVKALPELASGTLDVIGWGVTGGSEFAYNSILNGSTVDISQIHYNSTSNYFRIIFDPTTSGMDVDNGSASVFPPNLAITLNGYTFDDNTVATSISANPLKTQIRFDYTATGLTLTEGVAPSPELQINHLVGISQTLNHTGRRFIDRDRDSDNFQHTQYETESLDYQIDFSRTLADRNANISTVEWSVKCGSASLSNDFSKDNIAQVTIANPRSGKVKIECKMTDTGGAVRVKYIDLLVVDPDYVLKDYGS